MKKQIIAAVLGTFVAGSASLASIASAADQASVPFKETLRRYTFQGEIVAVDKPSSTVTLKTEFARLGKTVTCTVLYESRLDAIKVGDRVEASFSHFRGAAPLITNFELLQNGQ